MSYLSRLSQFWANWPRKGLTLAVLGILIIIVIGLIVTSGKKEAPTQAEKTIPSVEVKSLEDISVSASLHTTSDVKLTNSASLVSRAGGRVTAIRSTLGSRVGAGQIVVEIDGAGEANPARAQVAGAAETLALFSDIETQTKAALDNGVVIAQNALSSARAGQTITGQVQEKNRELASNSVAQAKVNQEKAVEADDDLLIRSSNLAIDAAGFAQDQATLAERLSGRQLSDAVTAAQRNLAAAQITRTQTLATLASQRVGLQTQLNVAAEQVKLMQVTSPIGGEVSRLSVQVGDFVRPGDVVGEVSASNASARTSLLVPSGVRSGLAVGMQVPVTIDGQEAQGTIVGLANRSGAITSLWQVDVAIAKVVSPASSIAVSLPITHTASSHTLFVPLDAVNVRETGSVVLTVGEDNKVVEHAFVPVHYYSAMVEGTADIPTNAKIIVSGNRTLKSGDEVTISGS